MSTSMNRRQLLGTAATAGLALRAQSRTVRAAIGANEKARVAVMGTNSRGTALARGFAGLEGADVVAICDVDPRAITKAVKAVRQHQDHEPQGFGDFRRVLDDRSVDALVIAAPDHWHAPAAILACGG